MTWGTMTVAGVSFREEIDAADEDGSLRVHGQESHPPLLRAAVEAAHHNVRGLRGLIVPVVFTDKESLSGFYLVSAARSELLRHANGAAQAATWQMTLDRIGTGRDLELESRMLRVARSDELAGTQTAVFWHAPAVGTTSYLTGPTVPSGFTDRASADGIVRVYTGVPADAPRWTVRADDYMRGAARISFDTLRRVGLETPPVAVWQVDNALVRLTPGADGRVAVACWDNGDWRSVATWEFTVAGTPVGTQPELTVLRNDPEEATVRLIYPTAPGRVQVDLSVRRGARFVTGVMKRHSSALLGLNEVSADAATAVTGGVRRSTVDADGNRFVAGSSRNVTIDAGNAALSYTGLRLDFFLGHEVDTVPAAGDAYADLLLQYLGSTSESVRVIRR